MLGSAVLRDVRDLLTGEELPPAAIAGHPALVLWSESNGTPFTLDMDGLDTLIRRGCDPDRGDHDPAVVVQMDEVLEYLRHCER